jgi:DNA invertase Pin-like site-specific DNA recombinase
MPQAKVSALTNDDVAGMQIGYARVSTTEQDTALQIAAMRSAGVVVYFEDQASGVKARPELERLLGLLHAGDTLVVYKVDRLARSLLDLLRVAHRLESVGASLRSLTEPLETGTPAGRMIFQLLGVLAEFERSVIRERCEAGRRAAVARGVTLGRRRQVCYSTIVKLRGEGLTFDQIAGRLGCSQSTAVKAFRTASVCSGNLVVNST